METAGFRGCEERMKPKASRIQDDVHSSEDLWLAVGLVWPVFPVSLYLRRFMDEKYIIFERPLDVDMLASYIRLI